MSTYTILVSCLLVASLVSGESIESSPVVGVEQFGPVPVAPVDSPVAHQPSQPSNVGQVVHQSSPVYGEQPAGVVDFSKMYAPSSFVSQADQAFGGAKPSGVMVNKEQYGQPESASIPTNYKPFGSWGLYIGGNPADGYYTNFYKSLDSGIQGVSGQPIGGASGVSGSSIVSPVYKQHSVASHVQAPSHAYQPYFYSPSELSSGMPMPQYSPMVGAGPVVEAPMTYADQYSLKRVGSPAQQVREISKVSSSGDRTSSSSSHSSGGVKGHHNQNQHQVKGQQQQQHLVYQSPAQVFGGSASPSPVYQHHQQQQQQVVAYSVPVASQIVGSQQGAEGSFNPYGIHAFTRYAVKPTLASAHQQPQISNTGYYYSQPQVAAAMPSVFPSVASYQPFGFYGVPLSQVLAQPQQTFSSSSSSSSVPSSSPVAPSSVTSEVPVPVVAAPPSPVQSVQQEQVQQQASPVPASPVQIGSQVASAPIVGQEAPVAQEQVVEKQVDKSSVKQ